MDKFLIKHHGFDFYSIHQNSKWWTEIIAFGYKYDKEFVPALSERMPIEEYFGRFRNEIGFTILAIKENEFVGCLCNFFKHPETNKPWYQCIIINEKYRQNKLAKIFYELSDEILMEKAELFVQGRTWVENIKNRKALKSIGFYTIKTLVNDRGNNIHTLLFEKCLHKTKNFEGIQHLGILGGMGSNASAKFLSDICFLTSQTEKEQEQLPITLYSATNTPDRSELILTDRKNELLALLEKQISQLVQQGASHLVVCCFSYHAVLNEINDVLRGKVVSLVDYTMSLLSLKKGNYLSLGTNGSYKLRLLKEVENIFYPDEQDQEYIHNCIYQIKRGEPKELVLFDIEKIVSKYNCTGIILACTDLFLVADDIEEHFKKLDIINPLKVIKYDIIENWKQNFLKNGL